MNEYQKVIIKDYFDGFIHKSLLNSYDNCKFFFKLFIDGTPEFKPNDMALQHGTRFHALPDEFFRHVKTKIIENGCESSNDCYLYFCGVIRDVPKFLQMAYNRFCWYQMLRVSSLQSGTLWGDQYIDNWEDYFMPEVIELEFKAHKVTVKDVEINLAGKIDQIDRLYLVDTPETRAFALMEYKTSGSVNISHLRRECVFYVSAITSSESTIYAEGLVRQESMIEVAKHLNYIGGFNPYNSKGTFCEKYGTRTVTALANFLKKFLVFNPEKDKAEKSLKNCEWCGYRYICWGHGVCINKVEAEIHHGKLI